MTDKNRQSEKIRRILITAVIVIAICLFYYAVGCPIRWLTGICCPSCGMTRAALSLITLDIESAFQYHPLVFCLPVAVLLFIFRKHIDGKIFGIFFWLFIVALLIIYIYRILSGSEIVYADFSSGIIYRIINHFKGSV